MAGRNGNSGLESTLELGMREINHRVDVRHLKFQTTDQLETLEGVIEQERALEAIETGLRIRKRNFNLYISGASGTGKSSILKSMLRRVADKDPVPPDWVLVNNFKRPDFPTAFKLPAGRGVELRAAMEKLVEALHADLPKAFHGKAHQEKIQRILNDGIERENKGFLELSRQAGEIGFQVKSTKDGLVTIPMVDGKAVSTKDYGELSDAQRSDVDSRRQKLEPIISRFLEATRNVEVDVHRRIQDAQQGLGKSVLDRNLKFVRQAFEGIEEVRAFLDAAQAHILESLPRFLPDESDHERAEENRRRPMHEYAVNVLVDQSETKGAPVVIENTPTYHNLIGKIEKRVENGIYSTDFTMVKAGALLRANGGYLVLHIREVLNYPFAWEALKGVLRNQRIEIEEMGENYQFLPTTGLRPDPIPVQCKVILIGSNWMYHLLTVHDEDFGKAFQVKAEFDSQVRKTPDTVMEYARFVATTCKRDALLPVDRNGVAAILEYGMRQAGSADRMTLRFNEITNLLIEADSLARAEERTSIGREHVQRARAQRQRRISLMADRSIEEILDGALRVDTDGAEVGIVNGLAVFSFADLEFGRPLRITARAFQGKAGVVNIEREARLSGNTYNKGVLILAGFLGDRFAQDRPLALTISLAVEQSYGGIDGDSASCAELCSILSALSDVPVRQDIAITGSVSQRGEVQAIGGINEKVEGFFQLCKARGLTGRQGVILPKANVRHLMLDTEVLGACKAGKFHLWAVSTIEEAAELLTGVPAADLFEKAAARLARYAEKDRGKGRRGSDADRDNGHDAV